jgi:deoxyribonuclease-4
VKFGAHVSIAGGLANAPPRGRKLGCEAIQIFVKNQLQWRAPPLRDSEVRAWREALKASGLEPVVVHSTYLINLAATDRAIRRLSREVFLEEIERCERLGIPYLNFHPGAHLGRGPAAGLRTVISALNQACRTTAGYRVQLLIEATAGQGSALGHSFEQLRTLIERARVPERLGVCLDTCHLFAAGYDLRSAVAVRATLEEFDRVVGLGRLRAFHLNDSLGALGSRRDRHANIGSGEIGLAGFRALVHDQRLAHLPGLLETPGGDSDYRRNLRTLRRLAGRLARPPADEVERMVGPLTRRRRVAECGRRRRPERTRSFARPRGALLKSRK